MEINFETQILRKLDRDGLSYMVGCTILEQAYLLRQTYFFPFRPPLKQFILGIPACITMGIQRQIKSVVNIATGDSLP